jgi:hypothetical protein
MTCQTDAIHPDADRVTRRIQSSVGRVRIVAVLLADTVVLALVCVIIAGIA